MIDTSINNPQTKKAYEALDSPEDLLRLWKEEGNLVAALFLAQKHHFGDEELGIFRNPEKLVITAELDSPIKLLYAFRQAYPSLTVEMEKTEEE